MLNVKKILTKLATNRLVHIERIYYTTSGQIASGASQNVTITIPNHSYDLTYFIIPQTSNYGNVYGVQHQGGSTCTLQLINVTSAPHTISGYVYCIGVYMGGVLSSLNILTYRKVVGVC